MIVPYAGIAQLVEHLIRNEGVVGSSPISGTIKIHQTKDFQIYCVSATPIAFSIPPLWGGGPLTVDGVILES